MQDKIYIKGARENNLKNVDVEIPRDKLVVVTGLSGSTVLPPRPRNAVSMRRRVSSSRLRALEGKNWRELPSPTVTGLSGSGKSSLAFDTIYAEGQRRYVESLSSYARMFLGQMEKPDVDYIDGLSPAISIDQKTTSKNPRSTVGTSSMLTPQSSQA